MAFSLAVVWRLKLVPGRLQGAVELVFEGAYGFVENVIGGEDKARRVFPLVFTMFIFTLVANLATFIPGQAAITIQGSEGVVPLFRAVMADYSLVFVMTIIAVLTTQIVAIIVSGPFGYLGKFINVSGFKKAVIAKAKFKERLGMLAQGLLDFFLGLMELVGELAKIISLSFRLFGNIFAGEVLTAVMLFLAPFFLPLPFKFLGLLTAVVQAFVFAVLTLIFITMASEMEVDKEDK
jgi:F-type H+-transporting ATPase subunit a